MKSRFSRLAVVTAAAAVMAGCMTAPAHAVTYLTCNAVNGAPSMRVLGTGRARVYYYHQCNVDPLSVGVVDMRQSTGVIRQWDGYESVHIAGARNQQSAAYYQDWNFGGDSGTTWIPVNRLAIYGNFTYGSVPGCGRVDSQTVVCEWHGQPKYVPSTAAGFGEGSSPIAVPLPAVPLEEGVG